MCVASRKSAPPSGSALVAGSTAAAPCSRSRGATSRPATSPGGTCDRASQRGARGRGSRRCYAIGCSSWTTRMPALAGRTVLPRCSRRARTGCNGSRRCRYARRELPGPARRSTSCLGTMRWTPRRWCPDAGSCAARAMGWSGALVTTRWTTTTAVWRRLGLASCGEISPGSLTLESVARESSATYVVPGLPHRQLPHAVGVRRELPQHIGVSPSELCRGL